MGGGLGERRELDERGKEQSGVVVLVGRAYTRPMKQVDDVEGGVQVWEGTNMVTRHRGGRGGGARGILGPTAPS